MRSLQANVQMSLSSIGRTRSSVAHHATQLKPALPVVRALFSGSPGLFYAERVNALLLVMLTSVLVIPSRAQVPSSRPPI